MNPLNANKASSLVSGPVRQIGVQSRSVTGTMPNGNRYESSLERDFMILLQFDFSVDIYTPQPVVVKYQDQRGNWCRYTPDGLIEWRADLRRDSRPVLVEIKYREAFHGQWRAWRERIRAAKRYADEHGWLFEMYTEREIRTPYLENARFLLPYRNRSFDPIAEEAVTTAINELIETTPSALAAFISPDRWRQAEILPTIWKLLAERRIGFDLVQPLTMQSPLWALGGCV